MTRQHLDVCVAKHYMAMHCIALHAPKYPLLLSSHAPNTDRLAHSSGTHVSYVVLILSVIPPLRVVPPIKH